MVLSIQIHVVAKQKIQWLEQSFSLCSTVHTVSALEHPLSAVLKDVVNSTITPVQGQLGPFRITEVSRFSAQNTMNWLFTNVRHGYLYMHVAFFLL